jgi:hypothetical protein
MAYNIHRCNFLQARNKWLRRDIQALFKLFVCCALLSQVKVPLNVKIYFIKKVFENFMKGDLKGGHFN